MSITIIGGGIAGLSAALALAKQSPSTTINILEKSHRLGGWINTKKIDGHLLETGPRTLRPAGVAGLATLDLICQLNLQDQVIAVSKDSASAKNRYIMTNAGYSKMPTTINEYLRSKSPVFEGTLLNFIKEPFIRPSTLQDESIHSFVSRRLGEGIAENLLSAIIHGIYAGDTRQLSVKSTLGFLWKSEKEHGSITRGILAPTKPLSPPAVSNEAYIPFIKKMKESPLYSFKNGMQTLSDALVAKLSNFPNVHIHLSTECTSIRLGLEQSIYTPNQTFSSSKLIAAIPPSTLSTILECPADIKSLLQHNPASTVTVTNLVYSQPLPITGFGVLIPRPLLQESNTNLGIIFDSDAVPNQNSAQGFTRLTVMSGGWAWNATKSTADSAIEYAERVLGLRHPVLVHSNIAKDCIPQYYVGHADRMSELRRWAKGIAFVGCGYVGVGVNDCIASGVRVGTAFGRGQELTGLEEIY